MSALEEYRVERDSGDLSLDAFLTGAPIADTIRSVEPRLMPELAPHLVNEVIMSLGVSDCSVDELNLVAKSLVSSLDKLDDIRAGIRQRQVATASLSLADLDY